MVIHYTENGQEISNDVPIADSSYLYKEIMGDNNIVLNFSLPYFVDFPVGSWIAFGGVNYTTLELGNVTKQNERWYDYTLTFESPAKTLSCYKFRNHVDGRLNFTITAQPREFIEHICRNMNMREGSNEWTVGDCIVSSEKTQSFSHNSVLDALNSVAELFETEWEISGKRISLKKVEYNKTNPLKLAYGKGNGFKSGISRQLSGEKAVDQLWVEGGDRNIDSQTYTYNKDGQTYHANKLRLPRSASFVYIPSDGVADASGTISRGTLFTSSQWNALTPEQRAAYYEYMAVETDGDGFGVKRSTFINNGYEDSLECSDIYPKKVLTISEVTNSDPEKHFWEIKATSNTVDYAQCLTSEQATLIFQDGMLEGKEFNWSKYDHNDKQFDIVPAEVDGIIMPDRSSGYYPQVGNTFAVFHINLPQQYIEDAEKEMLLTACEYLYNHSEAEVEFSGTVDGLWSKDNWNDIFPFIVLGGYVMFTDTAFCADGKRMRILSLKQYINNPHSPEITLSNSSVSQGISSQLKKIPTNQVVAMEEIDRQVEYTKRLFRDTKEMQNTLREAFVEQGDYFTESITPVSVETMQMIVGSEDLQFGFGAATTQTEEGRERVVAWDDFNFNPSYSDGVLTCSQTDMRHYSYTSHRGEITAATDTAYPYWRIAERTFTPTDPNRGYFLYAVCQKAATNANNLGFLTEGAGFSLETTIMPHTEQSYYFLIGILNKEYEGTRSFASLYGYTEVLGNRITTGRIVSADGQTWFDLNTGEIRTNKSIKFSWQGNEQDLANAMTAVNNTALTATSIAEANQLIASGYMLYRDPEFADTKTDSGRNYIRVYNNLGNGSVTHTRTTDSTAPNLNHNVYRITTSGTASPNCGGFYFANMSRANAIFVYQIKAKIPNGYYLVDNYNAHGNNPIHKWATSRDGDGTWREYVYICKCGGSGTFSSIGFFSLAPKSGYSATSVTWYVCFATAYDCSSYEALKSAFQNSTDIRGGVVLSNIIQVRNNSNTVTAGMNGTNPNSSGYNPRFWAGGDFSAATAAAAEANQDVHSHNLPILLLDNGYNSNIGIFKILPEAIAVMRSGQVVRISTNSIAIERNNYAPLSPVTRSLASGTMLTLTSVSNYTASTNRVIGTFPKTSSFNVQIAAASVLMSLKEQRTLAATYEGRSATVTMRLSIAVTVGGTSRTIFDQSITSTQYGHTYESTTWFMSSLTQNSSSISFNVSNVSAGSAIYMDATISISSYGNMTTRSRDDYFSLKSALTATLYENKSCFAIANGGFSCASSSNKAMHFDSNNGLLEYFGSYFKINNIDYARPVTRSVSYMTLVRFGNVVQCKISGMPRSSFGNSYIPVGFRPYTQTSFLGWNTNTNDYVYEAAVTTSGAITSSTFPSSGGIWGHVTYLCTEAYPT